MGQVAVSNSGAAVYNYPLAVPPGVGGMAPSLSLVYASGSGNGPVGYGWSLQGLSTITRCPATTATDKKTGAVFYAASDKLCLDGQRLIQTDESGNPSAAANAVGVPVASQANDAQGLAPSAYREYRTETDIYARIRAYGFANGDSTGASGPAYFKVWFKSGQVQEYGASPNADPNSGALITRYASSGAGTPIVWAIARKSDNFGNVVDYKYEQRNVPWGSGTAVGSATPGREWNIREIQYSGNKIIFKYWVDSNGNDLRTDKSEAYHQGTKSVSARLLKSVTTYVNSPNTSVFDPASDAVAVKSYVLSYEPGLRTGRNRLQKIQDCAGLPISTRCLPATEFTYTAGGSEQFLVNQNFKNSTLAQRPLQASDGSIAVIPMDFDGDGKTDLLRVGNDAANNELWISDGEGKFHSVAKGSGAGQFNITANLLRSDNCYSVFIADVNGDGLPDLIRYASATTPSGSACSISDTAQYVFINNGDGSFLQKPMTGVTLQIKTGNVYAGGCTSWCSQPPFARNAGSTFHLLDLNGDGKVDIVTASMDAISMGGSGGGCSSGTCTRVYLGDGAGGFTAVATNVAAQSLYSISDPRTFVSVRDIDGDGLLDIFTSRLDLVSNTPVAVNTGWRSRGDGNFDQVAFPAQCASPIDFNGDGRTDCLSYSTSGPSGNKLLVTTSAATTQVVAGFNLTASGQEFSSSNTGVGIDVFDINGDGRQDILRWEDDASKNVVYLSNGDGTFTTSGTFSLGGTSWTQLRKSDLSQSYVLGDFTGRGAIEILRTTSAPTAADASSNLLLVKADATPPDLLETVKSSTGIVTKFYYVPLAYPIPANDASADLGSRYSSDRRNTAYAVGNAQDLTPAFYVVASSKTDVGVGSATAVTEYSYFGFKKDLAGRGALGFREVRRQQPAPNGEPLTISTQYLQVHPYIGLETSTKTYRGKLDAVSTSQLLSSVANVYCDQTNAAAASAAAHCPVTAQITKPYVYQSTETGSDLVDGSPLPQIVTVNQYTDTGDPKQVQSTTTGAVAGVSQTFTKTLLNEFDPSNTACSSSTDCAWVLGRVKRSTVTSSVPNSLNDIQGSPGTSATAAATRGGGVTTLSPAVLSAILDLLLQD